MLQSGRANLPSMDEGFGPRTQSSTTCSAAYARYKSAFERDGVVRRGSAVVGELELASRNRDCGRSWLVCREQRGEAKCLRIERDRVKDERVRLAEVARDYGEGVGSPG